MPSVLSTLSVRTVLSMSTALSVLSASELLSVLSVLSVLTALSAYTHPEVSATQSIIANSLFFIVLLCRSIRFFRIVLLQQLVIGTDRTVKQRQQVSFRNQSVRIGLNAVEPDRNLHGRILQ